MDRIYTGYICRRTACSSSLSKVQHSGRIRFVENWKICTLHGKLLFFENFGDFFRLYFAVYFAGEKIPGTCNSQICSGTGIAGIRSRVPVPASQQLLALSTMMSPIPDPQQVDDDGDQSSAPHAIPEYQYGINIVSSLHARQTHMDYTLLLGNLRLVSACF